MIQRTSRILAIPHQTGRVLSSIFAIGSPPISYGKYRGPSGSTDLLGKLSTDGPSVESLQFNRGFPHQSLRGLDAVLQTCRYWVGERCERTAIQLNSSQYPSGAPRQQIFLATQTTRAPVW